MEFIEGAQRLRGSAKALGIWRMETKIEVLRVWFHLFQPTATIEIMTIKSVIATIATVIVVTVIAITAITTIIAIILQQLRP